jgi:hypothetical protein
MNFTPPTRLFSNPNMNGNVFKMRAKLRIWRRRLRISGGGLDLMLICDVR